MLLEFPKEGYDRRREGSVGKLQRKIIKRKEVGFGDTAHIKAREFRLHKPSSDKLQIM